MTDDIQKLEHQTTHEETVRSRVLSAIESNGVTPKSAFHFLLHEWVVWVAAGLAFVVGGIATALTLYIAGASQFMELQLEHSSLDVVFELVPLFWLGLFALAVFYTTHAVRETKRGYRYHPGWLVVGALSASMLFGYLTYASGFSEQLDSYLLTEVPLYRPLTAFHPNHWMRPEGGVLAGTVVNVSGDSFSLRTLEGELVTVTLTDTTTGPVEKIIVEGAPLRVVGTTTTDDETIFRADTVSPFFGRGGHMRGGGMMRFGPNPPNPNTMKENNSLRRSTR